MKKISILSVICMSLLAMNVSAKDIYVDQANGVNASGTPDDPTKPYKDLSYVLYKATTGGTNAVATFIKSKTYGAVVANNDNVYIVGLYDLTQDPAYYSNGSYSNDDGFWFQPDYLVSSDAQYNIVGYNEDAVFTTASQAWIDNNLTEYGGLNRAFLGASKYFITFKNIRFEHCGYYGTNTGIADRPPLAYWDNGGALRFENCTFSKNKSLRSSLLSANNVTFSMEGCTFSDNQCRDGYFYMDGGDNYYKDKRIVTINNCLFETNNGPGVNNGGDAGAIRIQRGAWDFSVTNTIIRKNKTLNQGGGIMLRTDGGNAKQWNHFIKIENVLIEENTAGGTGGGVVFNGTRTDQAGMNPNTQAGFDIAEDGKITFKNVTIKNNSSTNDGGAISFRDFANINADNKNLVVVFEDCVISGNKHSTANKKGGAVFIEKTAGDITFKDCTFADNTATGSGGAIGMNVEQNNATWALDVKFESCLFTGNSSADGGGAIYYSNNNTTYTANLSIINSTFYNNETADTKSGGMMRVHQGVNPASVLKLINNTVTGNRTLYNNQGQAGAIRFSNLSFLLKKEIYNNVFEGNYAGTYPSDITFEGKDATGQTDPYNLTIENNYIGHFSNDIYKVSNPNAGNGELLLPASNTAGYSTQTAVNPTAGLPDAAEQADYIDNYGVLPLINGTASLTKGDATLLPAGITTDQLGYTRANPACTAGAVEMFTVLFETNGGTPPIDAQVLWGGAKVVEPSEPASGGTDTFGGWYSNIGLTALWDFDTDEVDGPLTLYAKWDAATGLTTATAGKTAVSVSYYDLTGKPVPADTKGFVIKRTVYDDGSVTNSKAIIK